MSEWKPIETAPKYDGPIDTWSTYGDDYPTIRGIGYRVTDAQWCQPSFSIAGSDPCWCYEIRGDWEPIEPQPTHWMPFPEPPK